MTAIAVIGDVGGHYDRLVEVLAELDVDVEYARIPDGLSVVQVGDLVHRGPDSEMVVELVERFMGNGRDRWVQLWGNHETHYLAPPQMGITWDLHPSCTQTLVRWDADGAAHAGAAVVASDGSTTLISHAGLTTGAWKNLDSPADAVEAATRLEVAFAHRDPAAFRPGRMLAARRASWDAGCLWAQADIELYASWRTAVLCGWDVPFSQVHGHTSAFSYATHRLARSAPGWLARELAVDEVARHTRVELGGRSFVGVDPCAGRYGAPFRALVLEGELYVPTRT